LEQYLDLVRKKLQPAGFKYSEDLALSYLLVYNVVPLSDECLSEKHLLAIYSDLKKHRK